MEFVGNYAPCGLSPQTDGMSVILRNVRRKAHIKKRIVRENGSLFIIWYKKYVPSISSGTNAVREQRAHEIRRISVLGRL